MSTLHFGVDDKQGSRPACSRPADWRWTTDLDKVTCGNCIRTWAYVSAVAVRKAAPHPPPQPPPQEATVAEGAVVVQELQRKDMLIPIRWDVRGRVVEVVRLSHAGLWDHLVYHYLEDHP